MDWKTVSAELEWTYEKVSSLAGWSVDGKVVLTTSVYYVLSQRDFDAESFLRTMDELQRRTRWPSPVRGDFVPLLASFLDTGRRPAEEAVDGLFERQQILRKAGFRNTVHSFLAAMLMTPVPAVFETEAAQAKRLYNEMKKQHFLLTSDEDYSYAMLLGKQGFDPAEQAALMRKYYDGLNGTDFKSGNELQWLSQVLTIDSCEYREERIAKCREFVKQLHKRVSLKPMHYPLIGFMTLLSCSSSQVEEIIGLANDLAKTDLFRLHKSLALSFAAGYLLQQYMDGGQTAAYPRKLDVLTRQAIMAATIAAIASSTTTALS